MRKIILAIFLIMNVQKYIQSHKPEDHVLWRIYGTTAIINKTVAALLLINTKYKQWGVW
jgi:ABC-type uncharacterized transport system substrate-binding protein